MEACDSFSHRMRSRVPGTTGRAILCGQVLRSTQRLRTCAPRLLYLTRLVVDWVLYCMTSAQLRAGVGESCRANDACRLPLVMPCHAHPCQQLPGRLGEQASCGLQAFNLALSQPLPQTTHSTPHNNLASPSSSIDYLINLINCHLSSSAPLIPCITCSASIATQDTPPALSPTRSIITSYRNGRQLSSR